MSETCPVLDAFRYTSPRQEVSLVVWCVPCGKWHWHGAGARPGDGDGHRLAHCINEQSPYTRGGYVLHEVGTITAREMREQPRTAKRLDKRRGGRYV
jgi:hypothetical protein